MISHTLKFTLSILLFAISSLFAADNGSIVGKVVLNGKAPAETPIKLDAIPECKALHATPLETRHYIVDANGGLANVFVYVKDGLGNKKFPVPTTSVVLDQQSCLYAPYVLGVQVGQTLEIKNSDSFMHNVHGGGEDSKNKGFNIAQTNKTVGKGSEQKFAKPEVFFKFRCDVHRWMFAFVGVVDHPFFAVTGADGSFKISGLPDGDYTVMAKHPKEMEQTMKVKVAGGGEAKADFKFEPKAQ